MKMPFQPLIVVAGVAGIAGIAAMTAATAAELAATRPADAEVRESMLVSTDWLASHLDDPDVVMIHVAKVRKEYDEGHVPGAQFLAWTDVAEDRDGVLNEIPSAEALTSTVQRLGIDESKRIVIYDEGEGIPAARAYVIFDYLGLGHRAALLDGHWPGWKAEGRPVSTDKPKVTASKWRPKRLRSEIIVGLQEMREMVAKETEGRNADVPIIDARSRSDYTGATAGEHVPRPGHIPGAQNVPSSGNFTSKDVPRLRPLPQLRSMYSAAGAEPGKKVVVYCRTGASASLDYFVSKYLGYEPRLYDGSFSQWSSQPDTPVDTCTSTRESPE